MSFFVSYKSRDYTRLRRAESRRSESRLIASNHLQERSPASACTRRLVTVICLPCVYIQACRCVSADARVHASYEGFAIAWEEVATSFAAV